MKKLIKILFITIVFFTFTLSSNAKTNHLGSSDTKTGVKLHLKSSTIEKDFELEEIINYNGTVPIYSLEPTKTFIEGEYTEYANETQVPVVGLPEKWDELRNIAYFGHKYRDRTDIKWYIAAQYLIWDLMLDDDASLYFIDGFGMPISLFEEEITAIKYDIANVKTLPSFGHPELGDADFIVKKDTELTIEDKNGILNEFIIDGENSAGFIRNDNFLTIKYSSYGDKIIFMYKPYEPNLNMSKIYYLNNDTPAYLSRGTVTLAGGITQIKVVKPNLTLEITPDVKTNLSLEGFSYNLYFEDNFLGKFSSDELGIIKIPYLESGAYLLEPVSVPKGFALASESLNIDILNDDININLIEQTLKKDISIASSFEENYDIEVKYLIKNIDTLEEITTTSNKLSLPYGNYLLEEIIANSKYETPEAINFSIDANSPNLSFSFYNKLIEEEEVVAPTPELPLDNENNQEELVEDNKEPVIPDIPQKEETKNDISEPEIPIKKPVNKLPEEVKSSEEPASTDKENTNLDTGTLNNQILSDKKENEIPVNNEINESSDLIINIPSTSKNANFYFLPAIASLFLSYVLLKKIS